MARVGHLESPEGVEVAARVDPGGNTIYFVINHTPIERSLELAWAGFDHLSGRDVRELRLEPYSVAIVTRSGRAG
jgi:hypothetical protein